MIEPTTVVLPGVDIAAHLRRRLHSARNWLTLLRPADQEPRIAIYGAGGHTRILLQVWSDLALPKISFVFESGKPSSTSIMSLPFFSIDELRVRPSPHLIVLSSKSYENEMASACEAAFPNIPLLRFWD